jgi:hypothetical protein
VSCPAGVTFNGAAQTPCTVAVNGDGGLALTPAPVYVNNLNAGTATASFSYAGDANHDASSDSTDFTIAKAASSTTVSCPAGVTFNGAAQTPCTVAVNGDGGLALTPAPAYVNNLNAGTASASYSYAGDANHEASSDSTDFAIAKASSTTVVSCPTSVTYNGAVQTPCTVAVSGDGGLALTPAPVYGSNTNAGTATASYGFAGDANHDGSADTKTFAIAKAALAITADEKSKLIGASDPALTYQVTGLQAGDLAAAVISGSPTRDAGEAIGRYTIRQGTLAANANYTIGFATGTLTVTYNTCLLYDAAKEVKSGATLPIKIRLCSATGANLSASSVVVTAVSLTNQATSASAPVNDAGNANPGGTFRFDPSLGPGYIFNLKTTGLAPGTYRLEIRATNDPQPQYLTVQVR